MKSKKSLIVMIMFFCFITVSYAETSTKPILNKGKKWRIGYLEAGPFYNYPPNLTALIISLAESGWLEKPNMPAPKDATDSKIIWDWLSTEMKSNYLEFPKDAYYSENNDREIRNKVKAEVIQRLNTKKDIDFMIAMGTWAGQDLANAEHSVPTMVMSSSNPLGAKIIKSNEDSGLDHLHARVDPTRYERQVRLFHDIIRFKKLGVAYEDTPEGRTIAAIADIRKVAKEKGFEVIECFTKNQVPDIKIAEESVIRCHQELASKVDAVYITTQTGVNLKNMKKLLDPLLKHKIPTFSQIGSRDVQYGVLFSIAQANFKYVAKFHAETIAMIFNGKKPREIKQIFEDPPKISINIQTASLIGYDPPVDILGASDEIYQEILSAE